MTNAALQIHLNLGAADHLQLLHHAHNSSLAVATNFGTWQERVYPKREAIQKACQLEAAKVPNVFAGQNPMGFGKSRAVSNISCLANCFVDLDTYNIPELAGLDKPEILQRIIAEYPTMPRPTLFADSGRGMYLVWTFTTTKPASFLPAWQCIQNNLVELLSSFGADPKCRDVSRVLRVSGTENSKTLTAVGYEQIGEPVKYEELLRFSNKLDKERRKRYRQVNTGRQTARVLSFNAGFGTANRNAYTLAYTRMQDFRKLASLRGGKFTDCRKTALYAYAMAAAWYCPTPDSLRNELEAFITDCFAEPALYLNRMPSTVMKRHQQGLEGISILWNGKEYDARYRVRNATLIRLLGITASEQSQLACIIDKGEKAARFNRKRKERRRQQGMVSRDQYISQAQERRQQAMELFAQGKSKAAIAKALGVSKTRVIAYLNG